MQKIVALLGFLIVNIVVYAQDVADVLNSIEKNNMTLKALRDQHTADKLDNLTGINLANPNLEYNYFVGSPNEIGKRHDIIVTQSFDYATVFGYKKRLARSKNELLDIEYEQQKLTILQHAKQLITEIIYTNAALVVYEQRLASDTRLQDKLRKAVAEGEETKHSLAKIGLEIATATADIEIFKAERSTLLAQLKTINGGAAIDITDIKYPDWNTISTNSILTLFNAQQHAEAKVNEQEIKNARAEGVPEITTGYISELTHDEKFRGITIGVSIPLWSNHNNVRRAKARSLAQSSSADDIISQLTSQRDALTQRCNMLGNASQKLRDSIVFDETQKLLNKSLYEGEISLIDYLSELSTLYDAQAKALEAEKTYQLSLVELSIYK